jgi:hypothetical protein
MGMPGCPQDACHIPDFDTEEEYEAWDAQFARKVIDVPIDDDSFDYETEDCPHGLSASLCADPINHYPAG